VIRRADIIEPVAKWHLAEESAEKRLPLVRIVMDRAKCHGGSPGRCPDTCRTLALLS